jgi:hypothetical protein
MLGRICFKKSTYQGFINPCKHMKMIFRVSGFLGCFKLKRHIDHMEKVYGKPAIFTLKRRGRVVMGLTAAGKTTNRGMDG